MNRPPPAAPPSLVVKEGSFARSAAERITARRRTVTIRDTSDGCLAAGHANIRLGGRRAAGRARERASERVGDDATSRNRYLRTARRRARAGKSGENAFPQIIPAAPPPRRPLSVFFLRLGLSSAFSEPEPTSVAFGILAIPYQAISAGKGDGGGTGQGPAAAIFPSGELPPLTQTVTPSRLPFPFFLPTHPPSLRPSVVGISVSPSSHRNETEWNGGGTGGGNRSYRPGGRRDTNAGERK